jgi:predicted TIM-barrel fold metal-dependent hydrolase
VESLPSSFEENNNQVVVPTREPQNRQGALGIKFEAADIPTLDLAEADAGRARQTYEQYAKGGEASEADYKNLQDYLFRFVSREAGRVGLAVHIHTCAGAGGYYKSAGTNPLLLEPVFNDPSLRKTNFVMVHGGWPFQREVTFLLGKPNVYADISAMTFVLYPRELANTIRPWLEFMPEKVLFGSDVEPFLPHINWEETGWLCVTTGRKALAMALTGMMQDKEISREQALKIARGVLRANAASLYGLN